MHEYASGIGLAIAKTAAERGNSIARQIAVEQEELAILESVIGHELERPDTVDANMVLKLQAFRAMVTIARYIIAETEADCTTEVSEHMAEIGFSLASLINDYETVYKGTSSDLMHADRATEAMRVLFPTHAGNARSVA